VIAGAQAQEEAVRRRVIGQGKAVVAIISLLARPRVSAKRPFETWAVGREEWER